MERSVNTAQDTALSVLREALDMELQGRQFFEDVAEKVKHPRTKSVFASLVKQELRHVEVIGEELRRLKEGGSWGSLEELQTSPPRHRKLSVFEEKRFKQLVFDPAAGELEALKLGIEIEQKSIEYYRNAGARSDDPKAKEVFNWLVGQEAGHLTILNAEHEYRSNPQYYYDIPEFSLEVM